MRIDDNFLIMARTDIRGIDGLDAAIDRVRAMVDAGADAIFPEAMKDLSNSKRSPTPSMFLCCKYDRVRQIRTVHPPTTRRRRRSYDHLPVTLLRSAMGAAERVLDTITANGTQDAYVDQMLTRARLYDLVAYEDYNAFDSGIFNFEVPGLDTQANAENL